MIHHHLSGDFVGEIIHMRSFRCFQMFCTEIQSAWATKFMPVNLIVSKNMHSRCGRKVRYEVILFSSRVTLHKDNISQFVLHFASTLLFVSLSSIIGLTGVPLVDAGMRQLEKEGYMPQKVRLACSTCLVEGLNIPYQYGMQHFEEFLVGKIARNPVIYVIGD